MLQGKNKLKAYLNHLSTLVNRTEAEGLENTKERLLKTTESLIGDIEKTTEEYQNHRESLRRILENSNVKENNKQAVKEVLDSITNLYERAMKDCEEIIKHVQERDIEEVVNKGKDLLTKLNSLKDKATKAKELLTNLQINIKSKINQERERLNTLEKTSQNATRTLKHFFTDY